MITLTDFITQNSTLTPWQEGEKIPWDDPDFSTRMLKEHLSQHHGAASRKSGKITQHLHFIHHHVLQEKPSNILDLCCGPGLYAHQLTHKGHTCRGIDFGPASITYAKTQAQNANLAINYQHQDIRLATYGEKYDLVMLIFGEFNIFHPSDVHLILQKIKHALKPNGFLLLEPHTYEAVKNIGQQNPTWSKQKSGLFSDRPHVWLEHNSWDEKTKTATTQHTIIDAQNSTVTQHGSTMQAYTNSDYENLLTKNGFQHIEIYPSLLGETDPEQPELLAILAQVTLT